MIDAAPLAYRRRDSPLHAARATVAAAYGGALACAALIVDNPILLGALLVAVVGAAIGAGVARRLLRSLRTTALPLLALTVIVNVLVSRGGLTVFARLGYWGPLGQVNLTVEAVVYGAIVALRVMVVVAACLLVVCAADPDELLRSWRRVMPGSALTAVLCTRLVGVLADDARRLSEAQRCRPDGGARGARGRLAILRATVASALDRSLDVAAVLETRGYGAGSPPRAGGTGRPWSRHDLAFAVSGLALVTIAAAIAIAAAAPFTAYPSLAISTWRAAAFGAVVVAVALAPFLDRRGIST